MLNVCCLMGRCVETPELRHTQNGVSVTSFTIAVDRSYTPKGQDKQTDFLTIVGWRGTAEFCAKYFTKGQLIAVQGSIQTRNYTDKDGNKRKAFEIVADQVHFAEPKRSESAEKAVPQRNEQPTYSSKSDDFEDIPSDDDLPF